MNLRKCILTQNDCYKEARKIKPVGIVVHSTGANNPYLKRYVQPTKEDSEYIGILQDLGKNPYGNHWNRGGLDTCVHAFIGRSNYDVTHVYQTLPWDYAAWGVGRGNKGSYNYDPTGHIQFEICEDGLDDAAYFNQAFGAAEDLCAYLCKLYDLPVSAIVSHKEAAAKGYASNHGDPDHWLAKFGQNMDYFRKMVQLRLDRMAEEEKQAGTVPEVARSPLYRIRKSWSDQKSQIGAYANLESAKGQCPVGYSVFDEGGKAVYTHEDPKEEECARLRSEVNRLSKELDAAQRKIAAVLSYVSATFGGAS